MLTALIDEHVLQRYRALLDAEGCAFDELEHAFEEGDRDRFEADLDAWGRAVEARMSFLRRMGIDLPSG